MLKIRLQRIGRKNDPSFRVVCVDSRRGPKVGKHTEVLGSYDPRRDHIAIKGERVKYWVSNGAQVSDTVNNLLVKEGVIKGKKIHVARGKKKVKPASPDASQDGKEVKEEAESEKEAPTDVSTEAEVKAEGKTEEKTEAKDLPAQAGEVPKEEPKEPDVAEEKKEQEVVPEKKEVV